MTIRVGQLTSPRGARQEWLGDLWAVGVALGWGALIAGFAGALWAPLDVVGYFRLHLGGVLLVWAVIGLALRRPRGAGLSALGAVVAFACLGPVWSAPPAPTACSGPALRVATANLWAPNPVPAEAIQALLAIDADVIATQETSGRFWRAADALRARYPHRVARQRQPNGQWGVVLWSKAPLRAQAAEIMTADRPSLATAVLSLEDGRDVALISPHLSLPIIGPHESQTFGLADRIRAAPPDRIVFGDFNATPWSHAIATLERRADIEIIGGYRLTWRGLYPTPFGFPEPFEPIGHSIDHILISPGWSVGSVAAFDIPGSDHRGVVADIRAPCPKASGG